MQGGRRVEAPALENLARTWRFQGQEQRTLERTIMADDDGRRVYDGLVAGGRECGEHAHARFRHGTGTVHDREWTLPQHHEVQGRADVAAHREAWYHRGPQAELRQ